MLTEFEKNVIVENMDEAQHKHYHRNMDLPYDKTKFRTSPDIVLGYHLASLQAVLDTLNELGYEIIRK